ncbi:MucBP domain-containing protein, partial [Streptococcus mitis]|uniref:MucBP domain-containing protein n=1 Tax=Streptococcus mitis TaxID=28037 RepID=UPI0022B7C0C3
MPTDPSSPEDPNPADPQFPNPTVPTHPKDPKYPKPDNQEILKLKEEVNRTITYYAEIDGVKTPISKEIPTQEDSVQFERKGTVNLVTGETTLGNWETTKDNFDTVVPQPTVVIEGKEYTLSTVAKVKEGTPSVLAGKKSVDGETVVATDDDLFYEVVYTPVTPKQGNVVVEYYDTEGNKIKEDVEDTPKTDEGTDYDTKEHKDQKIVKNGVTYYYKEVKNDSDSETGKVKEGTTTVKYVYEKAGNVNINYVSTEGKVLQSPIKDTVDGKPGSTYNASENSTEKPSTITTAEGKTYRLVTSAGETIDGSHKYDENGVSISSQSSPSQGIVEAGVTKEVTYIYEEVPEAPVKRDDKAIVIYRHVDAQGSVVKELERTEEFAGKE